MPPSLLPAIAIPSTGMCRIDFATSLAYLTATFATGGAIFPGVKQSLMVKMIQSTSIANNRELLVMELLAQGATHIFFLDEDMRFPPWALHHLLRRNAPIIGANYRMRVRGGEFCAMSLDGNQRAATRAESEGTEAVKFMGFGVSLIERRVFETLPQPWFLVQWNPETKMHSTEDKPFFDAARAHDFPVLIDHDLSKHVTHLGSFEYRFSDDWTAGVTGTPPRISGP